MGYSLEKTAIILHRDFNHIQMEKENSLSQELCREEAVRFVAQRYGVTPEEVLTRYHEQQDAVNHNTKYDYKLEPNELALIHDLEEAKTI